MFGYYTPLFVLQAFCLYHAYRNNAHQRWYWLIMFIPGIGCAIYLYDAFYSRRNIESVAEGVKAAINTNYKIEKAEKALKFSDTLTNKIHLAEVYVEYGRYGEAVTLYKDCLSGYMSGDTGLRMKLLEACYVNGDFQIVIENGKLLKDEKAFKNSMARVYLAWAYNRTGNNSDAEQIFIDLDRPFVNYRQRLEYCKFLIQANRASDARSKIVELRDELELMKGPERKFYRDEMRDIKNFYSSLG